VRPEFLTITQRILQKPLRVLITGGSQGALPVNRAFVEAMDFLVTRKNEMSIVHQTGERDYDAVRTAYARHEILAEVVPFLGNMPERFAWADIIVCRAGAITAAEVAAAGRAAIFIPFGRATDSHQLRNAQEMAKQGAGRVITEAELTAGRLSKEIFSLLDGPQQIERMSIAARKLSWPNAARDIVNLIEQAAGIAPPSAKVRAPAGSSSVSTRAVSTPHREKVAP
jgi:UDP-N-acetylglucosamine--N-acetylmuramyl-(pentapeptide) pyrophosphoryl-undecaprenol N-acetylglucosamine transferase